MLPEQKYLLLVVVVDLVLYCIIHRFQYGILPVFSVSSLPQDQDRQLDQENYEDHENQEDLEDQGDQVNYKQYGGNKSSNKSSKSKQPKLKQNKRQVQAQEQQDDDISSDLNLNDDLESTFKRPGKIRQDRSMPLEDEISEFSSEVKEASVAGKDYFKDDDSKAIVENWDLDEYTQGEFVPEQRRNNKNNQHHSMDEVIIE